MRAFRATWLVILCRCRIKLNPHLEKETKHHIPNLSQIRLGSYFHTVTIRLKAKSFCCCMHVHGILAEYMHVKKMQALLNRGLRFRFLDFFSI